MAAHCSGMQKLSKSITHGTGPGASGPDDNGPDDSGPDDSGPDDSVPVSFAPYPVSTAAAAPSPKRLLTIPVRGVSSRTYIAELISQQTRSATWPGWVLAHCTRGFSPLSPALHPIPT